MVRERDNLNVQKGDSEMNTYQLNEEKLKNVTDNNEYFPILNEMRKDKNNPLNKSDHDMILVSETGDIVDSFRMDKISKEEFSSRIQKFDKGND